jgi:hypothetical protein
MANCCFIEMEIRFKNKEDKERCFSMLSNDMKNYDHFEGYVFDGCKAFIHGFQVYDHSNYEIAIQGNVNWSLEHDEMKEYLDYFRNNYGIEKMVVHYEELSSDILGKYVFDGKELTDYYLSIDQISDIFENSEYSDDMDDEDKLDKYHDSLYAELNNHPTVYKVC